MAPFLGCGARATKTSLPGVIPETSQKRRLATKRRGTAAPPDVRASRIVFSLLEATLHAPKTVCEESKTRGRYIAEIPVLSGGLISEAGCRFAPDDGRMQTAAAGCVT